MPLNPINSVFQVQLQLKLESEVTVAAESKNHPNKTTLNSMKFYTPNQHLCWKKRKRFFK